MRSLGIVSGGAASSLAEAIALGLDAFLTGEPAEHVMADARENGVHFIAGGHYATETFGVRRLGELVAERFGVEHRFIDAPNPDLSSAERPTFARGILVAPTGAPDTLLNTAIQRRGGSSTWRST